MKTFGLVAGVAGLVLIALWGLWAFMVPALFPAVRTGLLVASLALLLAGLVVGRSQVMVVLRGRRLRIGAQSVVYTTAVAVVLLLLNFAAARNRYRVDLTEGDWSLTPATLRILDGLQEPVELVGFFTAEQKSRERAARQTFRLYAEASDRVTWRMIDPFKNPDEQKRFGVNRPGVTVARSGERMRHGDGFSETTISNLIAAVSGGRRNAVFLAGHDSRSAADRQTPDGLWELRQVLDGALFNVGSLTPTPGLVLDPGEINLLIVAGPREPLEPFETAMIHDYLNAGGHVLVFIDPHAEGERSPVDDLLGLWAMGTVPGVVAQVHQGAIGWEVYTSGFTRLSELEQVNEAMTGRRLIFDRPGPLRLLDAEDPRLVRGSVVPLDLGAGDIFIAPEVLPGRPDPAGPRLDPPEVPLALITFARLPVFREGAPVANARLVVVGDADLADNYSISQGDNRRMISALVTWLTGESLVIREDTGGGRRDVSWRDHVQAITAVVLIPPVLVGVVGFGVLFYRRWR